MLLENITSLKIFFEGGGGTPPSYSMFLLINVGKRKNLFKFSVNFFLSLIRLVSVYIELPKGAFDMNHSQVELLFVSFIRANKERFYYLAYSYTKNEQDALDIVQDSIQKAIRSLHTLKDEQQLKSWFYKIVVRSAIDFLRKHKREQVMEHEKIEVILPQQMDTYDNIDLTSALNNLTRTYREVIILRYFEDLKIEDVAHVLDININTAKSRLYKALKQLKIQLQDEEGIF